jgi:hypothetical protein
MQEYIEKCDKKGGFIYQTGFALFIFILNSCQILRKAKLIRSEDERLF